ncbi:MAG TPA: hypothetical protein GX731_05285 [Clostridiales bacterium]|nr:hypothetical protein [Clostridiales bacterium]
MNILNMKPEEMVKQLSGITEEELIKIYMITMGQASLSNEDRNKALNRMDTGIYDENGRLIGDKMEKEDEYEVN